MKSTASHWLLLFALQACTAKISGPPGPSVADESEGPRIGTTGEAPGVPVYNPESPFAGAPAIATVPHC